ncbi:MAG: two-component regulator propeller domain-containing protein [Kangiellaceae bacterium]
MILLNFRHCYFFLTLILSLSVVPLAHALNPSHAVSQYHLKSWRNTDGLPQNTVTALAQTKDGYLWIGTLEGLVRFDGVQFRHFNSQNTPAIKHNMITRLLSDSQGDLWIGTSGGGLTSYKQGSFNNHTSLNETEITRILGIFEDKSGSIWIGSDGEGLTKIKNGVFESESNLLVAGNSIRSFAENTQGLWIASEKGLFRLAQNDQLTQMGQSIGLDQTIIRTLHFDHQGTLWIGTDAGIYLLKNGQFLTPSQLPDFAQHTTRAIRQDSHSNYWLATEKAGLIRLNKDYQVIEKTDVLFDGKAINTIFEDDENNLWVGSHLFGLSQLRDSLFTPYGLPEGLTAQSSRSIYEKNDGALLVGLEGGGVNYLDNGVFKSLPERYGLAGKKVYSMLEDSKGSLWFGTENGVTRVFKDHLGQEKIEVLTTADGLLSDVILALFESRDGNIWIGSFSGGLNRWRKGEISAYSEAQGLTDTIVNIIFQDRQSNLWVGTRGGGLFRLEGGHFVAYSTQHGLSDDLVFSLYQDKSDALWIGTYGGGLNRLKNGKFSQVRQSNGLFDDVIHRIIEDNNGYFWMSSNRGISKVDKASLDAVADGRKSQLEPVVYGLADGMRNVECNGGANAGILTSAGKIWFPTANGVVEINPQVNHVQQLQKKPIIESFSLNGQILPFNQLTNLEVDSGSIEIKYAATNLTRPENTRFRYKLVNSDKEWTNADTRRTAYYSALPSGRYQFRVTATNNGDWNGLTTDFFFTIKPSYYETWWFRLLALSLVLLLGYLLHYFRLLRVEHRNQELERLIRKRTIELESANLQLAKIATEDGLTGILNRRAFNDIFVTECRRVQRKHGSIGLMLVDIDYFKQYNDSLGHPKGDSCIKAIADILTNSCNRASEFVTRYGGDEFAIIFSDSELDKIEQHAANICEKVYEQNIPHPESPIEGRVTITIGVGIMSSATDSCMDAIISLADDALYQAKKKGRNQSVCLSA